MKNWLIRTKNNHILGPVTKEKIRDLIENGSIKEDDEICSGNGYWLFIREKDLVEKYVFQDRKQSFNPISEAKNVLTEVEVNDSPAPIELEIEPSERHDQLPSQDDLEYPDLGEITRPASVEPVTHLSKKKMDQSSNSPDIQQQKILEFEKKLKPERENVDIKPPIHQSDLRKNKLEAPEIPATISKNNLLTFNALISLVITFLLMLALALYFRGYLIDFFRGANHSFQIIDQVYAQTPESFVQKKKF